MKHHLGCHTVLMWSDELTAGSYGTERKKKLYNPVHLFSFINNPALTFCSTDSCHMQNVIPHIFNGFNSVPNILKAETGRWSGDLLRIWCVFVCEQPCLEVFGCVICSRTCSCFSGCDTVSLIPLFQTQAVQADQKQGLSGRSKKRNH